MSYHAYSNGEPNDVQIYDWGSIILYILRLDILPPLQAHKAILLRRLFEHPKIQKLNALDKKLCTQLQRFTFLFPNIEILLKPGIRSLQIANVLRDLSLELQIVYGFSKVT